MVSLLSFRHGVHPPDEKALTAQLASRRMPFPKEVVLPLSQHLGAPAKPIVRVGDRVERGDLLAEPSGAVSAPSLTRSDPTVVRASCGSRMPIVHGSPSGADPSA